ncbi:hypothetical protein QFC19_004194 [Naganishia cerealis]|uniref:Uncharacterized protein n=1 Tax=Naganishia cerealis TaxID=610337 RepID=A0ACC2VXA7_9TREE|nr:hypothetical protein QFC19_004194 [Naganishia cerealis]
MEEWLRPKKREIAKKKPQEEIDAEVLAHPTPMDLELRKAAKQRLKQKAQAAMAAIGMDDDGQGGMTSATDDGAGTVGTTTNTPTSAKGKGRKALRGKATCLDLPVGCRPELSSIFESQKAKGRLICVLSLLPNSYSVEARAHRLDAV